MIWNLYHKELKRNMRNLLIWSFVVVFLTLTTMAMYPYMKDMGESMAGMMKMMPQGMLKAFGIDPEMWSSILGLYNTYYGFYLVLLMGIFSGTNGATTLSKEERDKTSEFLLTLPLTRKSIFITKMLTILTLLLLIVAIQMLGTLVGIWVFAGGEADWSIFATMHFHGFVLLLFFTSVGVFVSMLLKAKLNFMGVIVGIVFGSYFLDAISKAVEQVKWLGFLSPNHYLNFNIFTPNYGLNMGAVIFFTLLSITLVVISYFRFRGRDIS